MPPRRARQAPVSHQTYSILVAEVDGPRAQLRVALLPQAARLTSGCERPLPPTPSPASPRASHPARLAASAAVGGVVSNRGGRGAGARAERDAATTMYYLITLPLITSPRHGWVTWAHGWRGVTVRKRWGGWSAARGLGWARDKRRGWSCCGVAAPSIGRSDTLV